MRTHKYRAWSTSAKRMISWEEMLENKAKFYTFFRWTDMYKLMQYTNKKDKDGKEIYEGDAHKWLGVVAIVKYSDLHAKFLWGKDDLSHGIASDGEVIGNIHDNPGLLEEAGG